jgi:hypothetical protein
MREFIAASLVPESWGVRPEISETFQSDIIAIVACLSAILVLGWVATRAARIFSVMRQGETRWNSRAVWREDRP